MAGRGYRWRAGSGLDTMSCGSTISLAMEMTETGIHNFNLKFGDADEYLKVLYEIAMLSTERGRDLAMGAKKLAAKYGAEHLAMEVKGHQHQQEQPYGMAHDPKLCNGGACSTASAHEPENARQER